MHDLTGKRFGRLVVKKLSHKEKHPDRSYIYWECKCDCGNRTVVRAGNLRYGSTKSCGCLKKECEASFARRDWAKPKKEVEDV